MGVHVVMYFYYLMSSMGPEVQKYLWWKRYITSMQLLQFVTFSIHGSLPLFIECNYPKGAVFFTLFTNFYIKSYSQKDKAAKLMKKE